MGESQDWRREPLLRFAGEHEFTQTVGLGVCH